MEEQAADGPAERGATGLPGDDDLAARGLQRRAQPFDLRGLADAVDAFKGNEQSGHSYLP